MDKAETQILIGYNQFLCAEGLASGAAFNLNVFEDFNKFIEAVILYDRIIVLGEYSLPSGLLASPLEKAGILKTITNKEIEDFFQKKTSQDQFYSTMADVFGPKVSGAEDAQPKQLLNLRISPNTFDSYSYNNLFNQTIECAKEQNFERSKFCNWISKNIFETRTKGGHFYYMARSILYSTYAESNRIDYAPDLLRLPIAALSFSRDVKPLPKALYDALVKKVKTEIDALIVLGMPVSVFIPPLTATLLKRVDSKNDYPNELLQIREKFSGFREAYCNFLTILQDHTVTLKEKIDAKKRILSRISGIIEKGESGHALNVKTIWDKILNSSMDDSGVSTKLSLSGMVSILIEQLAKEKAKGHAKALFDLWTDTLNMKNYGQIIEHSFKTDIDPKEVKRYQQYSGALRNLIKTSGIYMK